MAKLKNIIKQLSENDYQSIYESLSKSSADKSAFLLKALREDNLSDAKIMTMLQVNTNAYYTLRSRLNQKIEEYLLQQMESPRTDLLKKVANINEVVFTQKKTIAIATVKKLEKELKDYDLSNELTFVYKVLKKLHINTHEHFTYSQLYNQHVAYMLAVDKAEDILADYFKQFGIYTFTGNDVDKLRLTGLYQEMQSNAKLYKSHRLHVYQSCLSIFHRLFIEESIDEDVEPIEDILNNTQSDIFDVYKNDSIYFHIKLVFEYLRLEYYNHFQVFRKAETYYEYVNQSISNLLTNYGWCCYPAQFFHTKIQRALRMNATHEMYEENNVLFEDFEADPHDVTQVVNYTMYQVIACYYVKKYSEAAKYINQLLNDISLKKYPFAMIEIKAMLALQYVMMNDYELFNQLVNSIQRQIRILGKEDCDHIVNFIKILRVAIGNSKRSKMERIKHLIEKTDNSSRKLFSPTQYIRFDDSFLAKFD